IMLEVTQRIQQHEDFDVVLFSMQSAKNEHTAEGILELFVKELQAQLDVPLPSIHAWKEFPDLFSAKILSRPLVLILDEFDALDEEFINAFANEFRKIYTERSNEATKKSLEKSYLLHGLALIGIRSVLGIEHVSGSPFNVQRSLHIPNLSFEEVESMFQWYERDSGQAVESAVIERIYAETNGQPGLTCWFGELLTEGCEDYLPEKDRPMTMEDFDQVYAVATRVLPNNTLINIISKAKQFPYKEFVLDIFETGPKIEFRYNDPIMNFLYLHGVIRQEKSDDNSYYVRFSCPYIQKGLFDYFSSELFLRMGRLIEPFDDVNEILDEKRLFLPNLFVRYQAYLRKNSDWLFKDAPRRKKDLRIHEAVYHFNVYMYLHTFLHGKGARVWPEFPTGNGKLDILISYQAQLYAIEVKSFSDIAEYKKGLRQAAMYARQLEIDEIHLVFFIERIDEENRDRYESPYEDAASGVTVKPLFVETEDRKEKAWALLYGLESV
ncbi:MAG: hypothetical protein GY801_49735, partial [bacterium]|nr:hypothetical protein [bacterium]